MNKKILERNTIPQLAMKLVTKDKIEWEEFGQKFELVPEDKEGSAWRFIKVVSKAKWWRSAILLYPDEEVIDIVMLFALLEHWARLELEKVGYWVYSLGMGSERVYTVLPYEGAQVPISEETNCIEAMLRAIKKIKETKPYYND